MVETGRCFVGKHGLKNKH